MIRPWYLEKVHRFGVPFNFGQKNVEEEARSGRPINTSTAETIEVVKQLLRSDIWFKIGEMTTRLDLHKTTMHLIVHEILHFRLACARWILKIFLEDRKKKKKKTPTDVPLTNASFSIAFQEIRHGFVIVRLATNKIRWPGSIPNHQFLKNSNKQFPSIKWWLLCFGMHEESCWLNF